MALYGKRGEAWLEHLPDLVGQIALRLDLRDLKEVANLSHNYVLLGYQGNTPVVLKLGLDHEALNREAFTLKCYNGCGAVKVLAVEEGVLLIEQAVPGFALKSYYSGNEREASAIASRLMKKLHHAEIPASHDLPHVRDWLSALDQNWGIPWEYLKRARELRDRLLKQSSVSEVLLHGDLHHDNILLNGDDWVAIDPKGVIGWPMNEVWAFVVEMERDIPFIAHHFDFKVQDLFDWYFVHLVLAVCWCEEDRVDASLFLNLAKEAFGYISTPID
jgi:streptomycin 6-kinase